MHKTRYNALALSLELSPRGPLLIKAGGLSPDPSLPDMQFVRTYHPDGGEVPYIPGSSLKGVVRSFVEKALRTIDDRESWRWACATFPDEKASCAKMLGEEKDGAMVYQKSCGACRTFGHTRLRGRASITDLMPSGHIRSEVRYGVAISRLSHAVAQGPFEMETVVGGTFAGRLVLENYELWQVGVVAMALGAMDQGLLKMGFGKNRGFGEVHLAVKEAMIEEVGKPERDLLLRGLASFVPEKEASRYGLAEPAEIAGLPAPLRSEALGFYHLRVYDADGWQQIAGLALEAL